VQVVLTEMQQSPNPFRPGFGHDAGMAHSVRTLAFLLALATPPFGPPRDATLFGHIGSLKPSAGAYVMRFDPAILLSGKTASDYALATTGSRDVPNDNLIFDPEHTLLTYHVPATVRVTVVVNREGIRSERVSVATLRRVLAGKVKTFEPKNPFWIVVRGDTVVSLDQQYSP
jgi:hypothetical protein